jgi:hypothetical protein
VEVSKPGSLSKRSDRASHKQTSADLFDYLVGERHQIRWQIDASHRNQTDVAIPNSRISVQY